MSVALVCWDFGDTVVDERWMLQAPLDDEVPAWPEVWARVRDTNQDLFLEWDLGQVGFESIVAKVVADMAANTDTPRDADWVRAHCRWCCEHIEVFPAAVEALVEWRGIVPQACVTVNPDIFRDWVVPAYGLTNRFEMIVTSDTEHSLSKVVMAERALKVLGLDATIADCLLIDNRLDNCREFREAGGQTYHFRGDAEFGPDRARGRFPAPLTR